MIFADFSSSESSFWSGKGKIFVVTPDLPWRSLALSPLDVVNFEVVEVEQILLRAMSKEPLQLQAGPGRMRKWWENGGKMGNHPQIALIQVCEIV